MSPAEPKVQSPKLSDTQALRAKWNRRYLDCDAYPLPASVLTENVHLLPATGHALDLACGLGASALLLAQQGLDVAAWDLSPVAIERLQCEAKARGSRIEAQARDVYERPPKPETFDVIVVSHFLERGLATAVSNALRPGGLLFYQTFSREAVSDSGPSDPVFRLESNELLGLFPSLVVRFYREEGRVGDVERGTRDLAQLVAQRTSARSG